MRTTFQTTNAKLLRANGRERERERERETERERQTDRRIDRHRGIRTKRRTE